MITNLVITYLIVGVIAAFNDLRNPSVSILLSTFPKWMYWVCIGGAIVLWLPALFVDMKKPPKGPIDPQEPKGPTPA